MSDQQVLPPPGEFKTTEEIRDARFHDKLARRRRLLLWWSLPVVLIAFLVALKFISAVIINTAGISAYGNDNHNTAANRFENLEFVNVVEPWKPYFNQGTAVYATGDFFGATGPLDEALERVPKAPETEPRGELECAVRTNYSLSLEGLGDEAMIAEDPGTALDYYDQAQEMLADCADSDDAPDETQEADERQQESQEQAQDEQDQQEQEQEQQDGEGGEGSEDEQEQEQDQNGQEEDEQDQDQNGQDEEEQDSQEGEGAEDERDPREEELEERNREAQEEREQQEQEDGGGDGSGQNW